MNNVRTLLPGLLMAFMLPAMAEPLAADMGSRWTAAPLQAAGLSQEPQARPMSSGVGRLGSTDDFWPQLTPAAALARDDAALWPQAGMQDDGCAGALACGGLLGFSAALADGVALDVLHASSPDHAAGPDQALADDNAAGTTELAGIVLSALAIAALLWSRLRPLGKASRLDVDARRLTGKYGRRVPRIKPSATPALAPSLAPAAAHPAP